MISLKTKDLLTQIYESITEDNISKLNLERGKEYLIILIPI